MTIDRINLSSVTWAIIKYIRQSHPSTFFYSLQSFREYHNSNNFDLLSSPTTSIFCTYVTSTLVTMAPLNTRSAEILTASHCFAFSILLLLSAFTHTVIIISASTVVAKTALLSSSVLAPTYSLLFLLLEHLLEMILLKTLATMNRHRSILMLSALLF